MPQEETLFGAPDRQLALIHIALQLRGDASSTITLEAQSIMRKRWYRLTVTLSPQQAPASVLGLMAPMMHQYYMSPRQWAYRLGLLGERLGAQGYEVHMA